jgi:membrane-associated protease RseP (regulator of RpoE activity)
VESQEPIQIYSTTDIERDRKDLMRRGYVQIGHSAFSGGSGRASKEDAIAQAKKVGAQIVLTTERYSHTEHGAVPVTMPTSSTSYSTGNATAYGSGGTVNVFGSATTTTYGTSTTLVPYSTDRSNFNATFFAKILPRLGIHVEPLDDAKRRELGSNIGLLIHSVLENSPAFGADILAGDILTGINGHPVRSREDMRAVTGKIPPNGTAVLTINRGGAILEKTVTMAR